MDHKLAREVGEDMGPMSNVFPIRPKTTRESDVQTRREALREMSATDLNEHIDGLSVLVGRHLKAYNDALDAICDALTERQIRRG
jgi:hypothetical protein